MTYGQVWWPILRISALHPKCTHTAVNTHTPWTHTWSSAHTQQCTHTPWTHTWSSAHTHTLNIHPEQCTHTAVNTHTTVNTHPEQCTHTQEHLIVVLKVERALDISLPSPAILPTETRTRNLLDYASDSQPLGHDFPDIHTYIYIYIVVCVLFKAVTPFS